MLTFIQPISNDRQMLTIKQAAELAGRSCSWVRDRINSGGLRTASRDRTLMVEAASLERLLMRYAARRRDPEVPRQTLRLVVDNTGTMK